MSVDAPLSPTLSHDVDIFDPDYQTKFQELLQSMHPDPKLFDKFDKMFSTLEGEIYRQSEFGSEPFQKGVQEGVQEQTEGETQSVEELDYTVSPGEDPLSSPPKEHTQPTTPPPVESTPQSGVEESADDDVPSPPTLVQPEYDELADVSQPPRKQEREVTSLSIPPPIPSQPLAHQQLPASSTNQPASKASYSLSLRPQPLEPHQLPISSTDRLRGQTSAPGSLRPQPVAPRWLTESSVSQTTSNTSASSSLRPQPLQPHQLPISSNDPLRAQTPIARSLRPQALQQLPTSSTDQLTSQTTPPPSLQLQPLQLPILSTDELRTHTSTPHSLRSQPVAPQELPASSADQTTPEISSPPLQQPSASSHDQSDEKSEPTSVLESKSINYFLEEDPEEPSSFSLERPEELRKPSFSFTFFDARRASHIQSSLPSNKPRINTRTHTLLPSTRPTRTSRRVCAVPPTSTSLQSDFSQKQNDYFGLFRRMHCWKLASCPWMWGKVKAFDDRLVGRTSGMGARRVRSVMDLIGRNGW